MIMAKNKVKSAEKEKVIATKAIGEENGVKNKKSNNAKVQKINAQNQQKIKVANGATNQVKEVKSAAENSLLAEIPSETPVKEHPKNDADKMSKKARKRKHRASMSKSEKIAEKLGDVDEKMETTVTTDEPAIKLKKSEETKNVVKEKKSDSDAEEDLEKPKKKKLTSYQNKITEDEMKRTVFVGNLPVSITAKDLEKLFSPCGSIDSVRIRSVIPNKNKLWKKVAVIKNQISTENKDCVNGYVKYVEESSAQKALEMNGSLFSGRRIQVDSCGKDVRYDSKRSVFVGNLKFTCKEDDLFAHFSDCGEVERVRIIRDKVSGRCKGIGFVLFKEESSTGLALKLDGENFDDQPLRVNRVIKKLPGNNNKNKFQQKKFNKKNQQQGSRKSTPQKTSGAESAINGETKVLTTTTSAEKKAKKLKKKKQRGKKSSGGKPSSFMN